MNQVDSSGSIKFTTEEEVEGSIPFLDTKLVRREDGTVKTIVYRKKTHTDQYLNFMSHHPLHQKIGVVHTLLNRCETITSEKEDREKEKEHLKAALQQCGYPAWSMIENKSEKVTDKKKKKTEQQRVKGQVVVPYIQGTTEKITRILKRYGITTAVRPCTTLRQQLVHPKDKVDKEENGDVVYKIPCKMCEQSYIGETGRQLKTRVEEHKKDVNTVADQTYTRGNRKQSQTTIHKSAITDHAATYNHTIDWEGTKIVDKDSNRKKRQVREAIWIRRMRGAINRDEGCYELSHLYNAVIHKQHQWKSVPKKPAC